MILRRQQFSVPSFSPFVKSVSATISRGLSNTRSGCCLASLRSKDFRFMLSLPRRSPRAGYALIRGRSVQPIAPAPSTIRMPALRSGEAKGSDTVIGRSRPQGAPCGRPAPRNAPVAGDLEAVTGCAGARSRECVSDWTAMRKCSTIACSALSRGSWPWHEVRQQVSIYCRGLAVKSDVGHRFAPAQRELAPRAGSSGPARSGSPPGEGGKSVCARNSSCVALHGSCAMGGKLESGVFSLQELGLSALQSTDNTRWSERGCRPMVSVPSRTY